MVISVPYCDLTKSADKNLAFVMQNLPILLFLIERILLCSIKLADFEK